MAKKILVSWVGITDIKMIANVDDFGPLESVMHAGTFDTVFALTDKSESEMATYFESLAKKHESIIIPEFVTLRNPTHYGDISAAMSSLISKLTPDHASKDITIQVSSGTPSMTAVSILLGKKYGFKFLQSTREQGVIEPELPFDIAADFHLLKEENKLSSFFIGEAPDTAAFSDIITQSPEIKTLKQKAAIIAKRDVPVLITGETGTGKELFAKAIHNSSKRANKPLLILNCGAIPKDLIDTTLFGHVKGAFTGATTAKEGYFSQADGGTLFLDEFGELPLDSQVRLLRVIQQGTLTPVGSTNEQKVDVRIITATNKDLANEVIEGRFREDLFYRIAIGVLHLPALRYRSGDITHLAKALLEQINQEAKQEQEYVHKKFSVNAINFISKQPWAGNVRELQATILRATLWQAGDVLNEDDIAQSLISSTRKSENLMDRGLTQEFDINEVIGELTKSYVVKAMEHCHGNKSKAASLLGLKNYQTLNNWIDKYNIK
ncbi:sigma-54 dependent transcriptional regulator [Paraglaciecola sp.]|uniref:sigma-54 interaction domain-containing protein n=1 Tax=Paraglaciecola sp. TaxID=1920173 RepID=UPI0032642A1C